VTLGEGFPVGVSGQVVAVEDLGSDTLVAVRLATDDLITVRSTRQSRLVPGSQVRCGWTWSDTNFFDVVDAHRIRLPDPPAAAEVDVSSLMNVSQIAQYQDEEEHEG
jgi:hypothetical protein